MNRTLRPVLTLCLCLFPAAWSLAVVTQTPALQGEFQQQLTHPLAMHIHMVHLRKIDLREGKAIAKFDFHNAGASPITIKSIKPSCGCIQVRMHKQGEPILPGEERNFYLEVDTAGETAGLHEFQTKIEYQLVGDQTIKTEQVLYRVDVPSKKVTVKPRALIFYQLSKEETIQTVQLTDFRPESTFNISGEVQVNSDYLTAGDVEIGKDQYGHYQVSMKVTAKGTVPSGKHTGSVIINTDDYEFPQIRIPVLIYGPKAQNVE